MYQGIQLIDNTPFVTFFQSAFERLLTPISPYTGGFWVSANGGMLNSTIYLQEDIIFVEMLLQVKTYRE